MGYTDCTPEVAVLPDQAPDPEQLVALLDDQDRVAPCPVAIVAGLAPSDTFGAGGTGVGTGCVGVGAGSVGVGWVRAAGVSVGADSVGVGVGTDTVSVTDTVTELEALPPAPVHEIEYVEVLAGYTDCTPHVAVLPDQAPDSEQVVALLDDQDSLALCPIVIVVGVAPSDTVGAGVATLDFGALRPASALRGQSVVATSMVASPQKSGR